MKKIFVLISLISIILALSLVGLESLKGEFQTEGKATLVIRTLGATYSHEFAADGSSLLDVLRERHKVDILNTPPSKRLNCIDGVCTSQGFWWQLFVNGKLELASIDKYHPKDGDKILLEYGEKK